MYNTPIMVVDYLQVIRDSREELKTCVNTRERLDKRINELRIALRALVRFMPEEAHRQQVLEEVKNARRTAPSLSDAIATLLQRADGGMTSNQVRDQLEESGFDLDDYSQPLATIMSTLQRLVDSGRVKRDLTTKDGGGVIYKWKRLAEQVRESKPIPTPPQPPMPTPPADFKPTLGTPDPLNQRGKN